MDDVLEGAGIDIVEFGARHAGIARRAFMEYGPGSGSRARLNVGDCISYAVAKDSGQPLLFKGDDFTHTDIESART